MLVRSLTVENYFSFEEANTLHCSDPVTVVSGKNGTGKSNLLKLLAALPAWRRGLLNVQNQLGTGGGSTFAKRGGQSRIIIELGSHAAVDTWLTGSVELDPIQIEINLVHSRTPAQSSH